MAFVQDGETVDTLGAMFSNLDREVITKVLRSCGGNADRAIEKLLTVSDNPAALDSIQASEASQMAQDEALARELQRELLRAQAAARPRPAPQSQPRARVAHAYNEYEDSEDFGFTEALSDLGNSVTKTFENLFSSIGNKLNPNKQKEAGQYKAVAAQEEDDSHVVEFDSSITHREQRHDATEVSLEDKRLTRRNESKKEK
jgi:hypothetical protein